MPGRKEAENTARAPLDAADVGGERGSGDDVMPSTETDSKTSSTHNDNQSSSSHEKLQSLTVVSLCDLGNAFKGRHNLQEHDAGFKIEMTSNQQHNQRAGTAAASDFKGSDDSRTLGADHSSDNTSSNRAGTAAGSDFDGLRVSDQAQRLALTFVGLPRRWKMTSCWSSKALCLHTWGRLVKLTSG